MDTNIKLSFVIAARNEEKLITSCLASIYAEAYIYGGHGIEVILVDNNSTDRTKSRSEIFGVQIITEYRLGLSQTRKTGFDLSKGELVYFMDADDVIIPGTITRVLQEFEHPELVCLTGPLVYYDAPIHMQILTHLYYRIARLFRLKIVQGGNYVVRKSAMQQIGGHNPDLLFYGEDTDIARRISQVGKVKFSFDLPMLSSGRRLRREGLLMMGYKYTMNYLWVMLFKRPYTTGQDK